MKTLKLPPNPNLAATPTRAQQRGAKLFYDPIVGCANCHSGPTDGKIHLVGTKPHTTKDFPSGFNTPSLRGLWQSAPYLHDGTAETLEDALLLTKGQMGHVEGLTDDERADLVEYLKTL